jgi:AraC-like DNA-binding protein
MKNLPVYDITGLSEIRHNEVLVADFAPYLKNHHKLDIPHGHSFFHVVYFTQAAGNHVIDFDKYELKPFQIYFMIPGQVHNWEFEGQAEGYVLNFSNAFFQSFLLRTEYVEDFPFFQGIIKSSIIDVPESLRPKIKSLFDEMLEIRSSINNYDDLRVLMLQLFFKIAGLNHGLAVNGPSSHNVTLLRTFQKLIEKNFTTLTLPKEYAELLFVTPNHLNSLCTHMLGISAGELIRKRILLEAKRLLVNLDLPISQIAWQLNFSDNSYFSKFFKKQEGVTPEVFRKQIMKS